jgi:Fe-Mn family superoxide dismutase
MPHQLPQLPYAIDALEPHISAETRSLHHGMHHATYVAKLNGLIQDTEWASRPLNEIVTNASGGIFNNGAQAWNHDFYWQCLSPNGGGEPEGELAGAIARDFGDVATFREQFSNALTTLFGSGWVWLTRDADGRLSIQSTSNAGNPLTEGQHPILTCDMWEHAYYLDYRNEKARYVEAFWQMVNWEFAAKNLGADVPYMP